MISINCRNFTVLFSFFDVKKQGPKTNLEKCYQYSADIDISLDLKVYFSLVTCKINNLIALRSTNQIIEILHPDDYYLNIYPEDWASCSMQDIS